MSTPQSSNLPAGRVVSFPGIYIVSHLNPAHAVPHDVLIKALTILPKCNSCAGVRFSLRSLPIEWIEDNQFFQEWPVNKATPG